MKRKVKIFFIIILVLSIFSTNVYAYTILFGTKNFDTNQYALTLGYRQFGSRNYNTDVNRAINAWNQSDANIYIFSVSPNTGENFVVDSDNYGNNNWDGFTQAPTYWALNPNTAFIKINDNYYDNFCAYVPECLM